MTAIHEKTIKMRRGRFGKMRPGHPWVYKRQIARPDPSIKPGSLVPILDPDNRFIGRGYYNPHSDIAVRIVTFHDEPVDQRFFDERIRRAFEKRAGLFEVTNAYRVVFSEGDGLPGLIVDRYADTVVFQILTLGIERFRDMVINSIGSILDPRYLYEKSDASYRKAEGLGPVRQWRGPKGAGEVEIREGKARFIVDIENGHKTGFYLDQRKARLAIAEVAKGKRVLDLFSYIGGFLIHAARGGAALCRGVDIKREWLALAVKNAALNGVSHQIALAAGDAFSVLRKVYSSGEKFDIIIVDPPSFVRARKDLAGAEKGYKELNLTAMKSLSEGGLLATFSCSHHMPADHFSDIIKRAAADAHKTFTIVKRCHQAEDHPIVRAIPETEYLKGYFLRMYSKDIA